MNEELEILLDIDKAMKAIDKQIDSHLFSLTTKSSKRRKVFREIYEKQLTTNKRLFTQLVKKYD